MSLAIVPSDPDVIGSGSNGPDRLRSGEILPDALPAGECSPTPALNGAGAAGAISTQAASTQADIMQGASTQAAITQGASTQAAITQADIMPADLKATDIAPADLTTTALSSDNTSPGEGAFGDTEPREIEPNARRQTQKLVASARPTMEVFRAIFRALDAHARPVIGPAERELFAIPLHDHDGTVTGGLWASTMFRWLNVELLFVPESLRGRGVGSALIAAAETEAMRRGCLGAFVDTASFQAPGFYQRLGYTLYGRLGDFPPGHERLYFRKLFGTGA